MKFPTRIVLFAALLVSLLLQQDECLAYTGGPWTLPPANLAVTIAEASGTTATITPTGGSTAGITVGMIETFTGASIAAYNATPYTVITVNSTTFTITTATALGTPTGTITTAGAAPIYTPGGYLGMAADTPLAGFGITNTDAVNVMLVVIGGINGKPTSIIAGATLNLHSSDFTNGIPTISGYSRSNTAAIVAEGGATGKN